MQTDKCTTAIVEVTNRYEAGTMRDRKLPATDANYRPLKSFVARRGGVRLGLHGTLRDRLVEMVVEEWPLSCPIERLDEVVQAKVARRVRERYRSVVATFLLTVLVNAIVRLVVEWWFDRPAHRLLLHGWASAAQNSEL